MRSNALNIPGQPSGLGPLAVAAAAAIVLAVGGFAINARVTSQRIENVRGAVLAQGYGDAVVQPIRGDECWRGREGFTWTTAKASGSACAGPRGEVTLHPGVARPRL